jgi:hypothetical protein
MGIGTTQNPFFGSGIPDFQAFAFWAPSVLFIAEMSTSDAQPPVADIEEDKKKSPRRRGPNRRRKLPRNKSDGEGIGFREFISF